MALRDQPYIPLYVNDFLTDEKLLECSVVAHGIYIRLICLMHKSEEYGTIFIQDKHKQSDDVIENFAMKLVKYFPFPFKDVYEGLKDLLEQNVIQVNGTKITQKRMVEDNRISLIRAEAGKKGGQKSLGCLSKKRSKTQANYEYENENENKEKNQNNKDSKDKSKYRHISKEKFPLLKDSDFFSAFKDYLTMRKTIKKPATEKAVEICLNKLSKYKIADAIDLLNTCIVNNWQGIDWAIKEKEKHGTLKQYRNPKEEQREYDEYVKRCKRESKSNNQ